LVSAAGYAAKIALDMTLEAESIKKVNAQFENLTRSAGIATQELEEGLKRVSDGLVDDTDLLNAANQAIIGMGKSAERLPEIFTLARKATQIFGGDTIKTFEAFNQALATGQTRQLRQFGITVDAASAMAKYGQSIGKVNDALTDADKRQAILNAVLDAGAKQFDGVQLSTNSATASFQILKATINDIKETSILFFDRVFGDLTRASMKRMADTVQDVGKSFKYVFGSDTDKAAGQMAHLRQEIKFAQQEIERFKKMSAEDPRFKSAEKQEQLKRSIISYSEKEKTLTAELEKLSAKNAEAIEKSAAANEKNAKAQTASTQATINQVEVGKQLLADARQLQQIEASKMAAIRSRMEVETEGANMQRLYGEQRQVMLEQEKIRLMELDGQLRMNQISRATYNELTKNVHAQTVAEIEALELRSNQARLEAAENLARKQQQGFQGLAAGAKFAAASASRDFGNMSALGKTAFDKLGGAAANSLMAIGDGSKDAASAMGGFFMGALGDIAESQGKLMLLSSIFPPNPAAAAGGAALLVLAGFLRSRASAVGGAGGGGGGGGVEMGGGGGGGLSLAGPDQSALNEAQKRQIKREVTIQIQGHYLDSEGSRRELMNMLRQESDATDFKYVQIGQGA
jgi:hypothetical protein